MFKRIAAITAIFVCTAVAWAILGASIFSRTESAESGLSGRVASTWGAPQEQAPPAITREWQEVKTIEDEYDGKKRTRKETYQHSDRKSTRLNSSHSSISYAVFCLKK